MAFVVYPTSLPGPVAAPFQPAERRLLSSLPGVREARAIQRDRKATQQLDFIYTDAECAIYEDWRVNDLVETGSWFAASWPQPQGGVGVRRFVSEPSLPVYYPKVGWHVSAQVEVRGRGMPPRTSEGILLMHMEGIEDPTVLFDEYGHHGSLFDAGPSAGSGVVASAPLEGVGSLYLAQYAIGGGLAYRFGIVPPSPDFAIEGPFTINLSHATGFYRGQSGLRFLLTTSTASAVAGQWGIAQSGGTDLVFYINTSSTTSVQVSVAMPSGRVDIEAARTEDGHLLLFLGGELVNTSTATTLVPLVGTAIGIGGRPDGVPIPNDYADGWYDEIRIVPSVLHAADYTPAFPLLKL